jgi:hypothetical protein
MLLACRFLADVANVNSFDGVAPSLSMNVGDTQALYFQLVDASVDRKDQGFNPPGRRYIPAASSTVSVTLTNTDTGPDVCVTEFGGSRINPSAPATVTRGASNPFAQDTSIWKVQLLGTDSLKGTVNVSVTLTEPGSPNRVVKCGGLVLRMV